MRKTLVFAATGLIATPAMAGELTVTVEIPRLKVAEYHKPYVAIWIETADGKAVSNLDVWYDIDLKGKEAGTKWLPDLRTWWRKSGRTLAMPATDPFVAPIVYAAPVQLLAYHTALHKGTDVDQPRNLAKSVTVE